MWLLHYKQCKHLFLLVLQCVGSIDLLLSAAISIVLLSSEATLGNNNMLILDPLADATPGKMQWSSQKTSSVDTMVLGRTLD